ncbi:hypothetical protein CH373_04205 [Leptospira perolatii]|uniref:PIN domain-containing protein n=1 Tax=Leptospira perolatii TaxID=2023191 RepID=A0A2M9ZQ87_9LEPT|nr:hypothetical protein [Leptospira perolatii]PJZ69000.1 hypothetical protein CH360_13125 [Leptospira perolatii]PJZ74131.1 hypothetical protein CH373_04205 [Leptospira perolatii]
MSIHQIIQDLIANPGVSFEPAYYPEAILSLWPKYIKDYDDAVLTAAGKILEAKIVTFDNEFIKSFKKLNLGLHHI